MNGVDYRQCDLWGDPIAADQQAFLERLDHARRFLVAVRADFDAAVGLTAASAPAIGAALSALEAAIAAEDEWLEAVNGESWP